MKKSLLDWIAEAFYPKTCLICETILPYVFQGHLCHDCEQDYPLITGSICKKCGKPLKEGSTVFCFDCFRSSHHYEMGRALWSYQDGVKEAIHQFKYHNKSYKGRAFAYYMSRYVKNVYELYIDYPIDLIVAVPLHKKRERERGYNQVDLLCRYLSKALNLPYEKGLLIRNKLTEPMNNLTNLQRINNIRDAFSCSKKTSLCGIMGKSILLVDDIYTTGTTVDEVARILKEAGASAVYVLSISIGRGYS